MSSSRTRVPRARPLVLAWAGLALAWGTVQAEAPVAGPGDIRICGAGIKSSYEQDLALYQTAEGIRLLKVPAAELANELAGLKSADSSCLKATAAGLAVVFPGMPAIPTVSGVELVRASPSANNFEVLDPVVCQSFGAGGQSVRFGVNDSVLDVGGWESISYDLSTNTIRLAAAQGAHGPLAQCHVFPYETTVEDPPAGGPRPSDPNALFSASFESRGDLLVEIVQPGTETRAGQLDVYPDIPFNYDVLVTNLGEAPVAGVAVREFLPALPREVGSSQTAAPVLPGPWTCTGARCPLPAAGVGKVDLDGITLAPGESVRLNLTRTVATNGDVGVLNVAAIAAFVDSEHPTGGSEMNPQDNGVPVVLSVQANQPPSFACTPATVNMSEDGAPVDVSCVLSDAEGDPIAPMTIANALSPAVTALLEAAPLAVVANGTDTYDFTVQPKPDAHGSVTLQLQTTDGLTGTSQYDLVVNVASVDDPPTFDTYATTIVLSPDHDGALHDELGAPLGSAHYFPTLDSDCFNVGVSVCTVLSIANFFEDVQPGPPNEVQTVQVDGIDCSDDPELLDLFAQQPAIGPAGAQPAGSSFSLGWRHKKTAAAGTTVSCDVTFRDNGNTVSAPTTIHFVMGPLPPP